MAIMGRLVSQTDVNLTGGGTVDSLRCHVAATVLHVF